MVEYTQVDLNAAATFVDILFCCSVNGDVSGNTCAARLDTHAQGQPRR